MPNVNDGFSSLNYAASRPLRLGEQNAVLNAVVARRAAGKPVYKSDLKKTKEDFAADRFSLTFSNRNEAIAVLQKFDANRDGYLAYHELGMNKAMLKLVDGCQDNFNLIQHTNSSRAVGEVKKDQKIAVLEMANALIQGRLAVGERFATPDKLRNKIDAKNLFRRSVEKRKNQLEEAMLRKELAEFERSTAARQSSPKVESQKINVTLPMLAWWLTR